MTPEELEAFAKEYLDECVVEEGKRALEEIIRRERREILGPRAEGEVWTVEMVKAGWGSDNSSDPLRARRREFIRQGLLKAISEGRCEDPRACCALLA